MGKSTGLQRRVLVCKRCGGRYTHTNRMERRKGPEGGWDYHEATGSTVTRSAAPR